MAAFTAIAAGIGLATTAATTGMSFGQAAKQKRMAAQANKEANKAMKEARARLEVNYAEALSIPKEAYELEREALLSQGAQALDAARESERGSAATAGRVLAAQQRGQAETRTAMAQDLFDIEAMKLEEESRLRDLNVQLDLEEIMGAQQKAADARAAATAAKQAGSLCRVTPKAAVTLVRPRSEWPVTTLRARRREGQDFHLMIVSCHAFSRAHVGEQQLLVTREILHGTWQQHPRQLR